MYAIVLLLALSSASPRQAPGDAKQRIEFDDNEVVEGTTARGEGELMLARKRADFGKLIRLCTDFVPELLRSADAQ